MKKTNYTTVENTGILIFLMLFLFAFAGCRKENIPAPSDFTKDKREKLGDLIQEAIADDPSNFPTLATSYPYDSTYWYVQKLYDQAINSIKIDANAPKDNRWNRDREWSVTILKKDFEKSAFVLPGGHLYITTGLMKSLDMEYQLYYILAFEASLMNERFLLNRLINEYNTTTLDNILRGIPPTGNEPSLFEVALTIDDVDFDEDIVEDIDLDAISLICKTSIFDRAGIISILDVLDESDTKWLQTRKSYNFRDQIDYILNVPVDDGNCGTFTSNGGYQKYILERL